MITKIKRERMVFRSLFIKSEADATGIKSAPSMRFSVPMCV